MKITEALDVALAKAKDLTDERTPVKYVEIERETDSLTGRWKVYSDSVIITPSNSLVTNDFYADDWKIVE